MTRRKPTRKARRRERREAARHGRSLLEFRDAKGTGKRTQRSAVEPFESHEGFRRDADKGA